MPAARNPPNRDNGPSPSAQVASAGAWGLSGRVVLLVANLLATPFTIRLLGPSGYGLWALLLTSLNWAVISSMGMGLASTKFGADCYSHNDDAGESAVVWTALAVLAVTTTGVAALVAIEAPFIVGDLLHVRGSLSGPSVVALRIFCGIFVAQAVSGVVNTPQVVRLRWGWYTVVRTGAMLIATTGAPVALAITSGGVVTAAVIWLGSTVLGA